MSSYEEVVQKDLELLWVIQEYCRRTPWIANIMHSVVSKHPLKDIVSVLWAFFFYGVVELQFVHFWVVVSNLVVASGKDLDSLCCRTFVGFTIYITSCSDPAGKQATRGV